MIQKQVENKINKYVGKFLKERPSFESPIVKGPHGRNYITNGHFMINTYVVRTLAGLFNKVHVRGEVLRFERGEELKPVCIKKRDFTMLNSTEAVELEGVVDVMELAPLKSHINKEYFNLMVALGATTFYHCGQAVEFTGIEKGVEVTFGYCMAMRWEA